MATYLITSKHSCAICNMKFSLESRKFFCSICHQWNHIKCNSANFLPANDKQEYWCTKCLTSIFPFNHFDDDIQFLNCVFDMKYNTNNILQSTEQFKICSEFSLTSNPTIDPDKQLYSVRSAASTRCNYYLPDEFDCHNLSNESFSILHINARSLNKNLEHVTTLISTLNYCFTVIAISETWATVSDLHVGNLHIPGYILFSKPRSSRGGASLYIKENIACTTRPDLSMDSDGTCESIFIKINNYFKRKTIVGLTLTLTYAPRKEMRWQKLKK
jgi:hypothetical protein